jgi:hypothetical protein
LFPAEVRCVRDHLALRGKFIPQSGKNLPTFGIHTGKHMVETARCDGWNEEEGADRLERV